MSIISGYSPQKVPPSTNLSLLSLLSFTTRSFLEHHSRIWNCTGRLSRCKQAREAGKLLNAGDSILIPHLMRWRGHDKNECFCRVQVFRIVQNFHGGDAIKSTWKSKNLKNIKKILKKHVLFVKTIFCDWKHIDEIHWKFNLCLLEIFSITEMKNSMKYRKKL